MGYMVSENIQQNQLPIDKNMAYSLQCRLQTFAGCCFFIELSKAFDLINHHIFIQYNWFQSYLFDYSVISGSTYNT